ncbi:hypothetical protein V2A60_003882 [Cordyceps javanica]
MRHTTTIALAIAQFVLGANADVDLDIDDVPTSCKAICRPITTLSDRCDVDLRSDNDRDEHLLQNQCICTNKSFDVGKIAALCADCMHQSRKPKRDDHADKDDLRDIDEILSVCGFSSTTYNAAAASTEVASVTVDVTRPTDVSQLTTTIDRSHPATGGAGGGGSSATATSSGQSGRPTSAASSSSVSGTASAPGTTATVAQTSGSSPQSSGASSSSAAASSTTPNAAAAVTAQAVYAVGGLVAAAYLMV